MRFHARRHEWLESIELQATMKTEDGRLYAKPIEMREKPQDGMFVEPFACISRQAAVALMDDLWGAGIRPSSGEGNEGQLGATQKHLSDMRSLVKKALDVDL